MPTTIYTLIKGKFLMKLISKLLIASLLVVLVNLTAYAEEKAIKAEKPLRQEVALLSIEATVESIDRSTRQVSLKNVQGEIIDLTLDEDAGRLDDIDKGDRVSIEYLEAVTIEVFGADEIEPGAASAVVAAETEAGEKPAALVAEQVSLVVTIEEIDLENELVTLKNMDGELKTVSPEYPENLKKVKVGDRVKITYTTAVGFSVTEK